MMNRESRRKKGRQFIILFGVLAFIFFITSHCLPSWSAYAQEPVETLDKIDKILNTVKGYVDVITNDEIGEQELLAYLPTFTETNSDIQERCQTMAKDAGQGSAIVDYEILYAGLLGDITPVELVRTVKDKLAVDGFNELNEKKSGGLTRVYFDQPESGDEVQKHYILWINKSWRIRISDFFKGRNTNNSFCLVKVQKL